MNDLDQAIAEFLCAPAAEQASVRTALLERYPGVHAELKEFFADHDRMQKFSQPLKELASPNGTSREPSSDVTLDPGEEPRGRAASDVVMAERIGRYSIQGELGRGGMGVVYKAHDTQLGRTVALKMIPSGRFASEADLERFRGEAKLAASLSHPGIVPIFEADEWQGLPFFAMGLVEGLSLADLIREGPLDPFSAVRLLKKIASAVAFAHGNGVIHRDLKPANVLLSRNEGSSANKHDGYEPAITDFGLAKRLGVEEHLTTTGQVLGTPAYMSPEQASGSVHEIGEGSDIYALGAMLYAMLAGHPPFQAASPVEVILQVLERDPPPLKKLNAQVPPELEAICMKCLEKRPEYRYVSAAALIHDLDRFLQHEPPEAGRGSLLRSIRRWGRREPVFAWHLGGLAFILLLVQIIFAFHRARDWQYHINVCLPLILWLVGCFGLRQLSLRDPRGVYVHYLWSALDALCLTALLSLLESHVALLMSSYSILICVASLSFRTRLVAFTTMVSLLCSIVVFILQPTAREPLHHAVLFMAMLGLTGFVVGYQVWRFGILREYYEDRR